jgi:FtsP/CotA-like multicopper oxidase with cupredoxin domain
MRRDQLFKLLWLLVLFAAIPLGVDRSSAATYGPNPDVNYDVPNFTYSPPLQKFIDKLPLLGPAGANNLGQYIPVAVPDTTTYPGSDYYEIALVQYREQMHSNLPPVVSPSGSKADPAATGGTLLRGYVQEHNGVMDGDPHYLGPLIIATKDRPVRIKFTNRLPVGAAGDLFLPIDTEIMGSGAYTTGDLANPASLVSGTFTQNRATLHLHGGLPGWTSDGTAHQWITPAGEFLPGAQGANYPKGLSAQNVPDMPLPADGSMTFMWPNQISGRLMFYHDHALGLTGPNVYAGEAAGFLLVDPVERALTNGSTPGVPAMADVPLVIQDRTFVPDAATLAATDPLWDTAKWGGMGNFWMPHVYMPNQDPFNSAGATPFGRWDYGPWFWPVFAATGPMPLISHIPEMFMDTPLVNGTAYPYLEVDPKTYRFRILNASNDRMWNLQLYLADPAVSVAPAGLTEVKMIPANLNASPAFPDLWKFQTPGMIPDVLDGRPGGVPDPALIGPAMIQIGTEGGLLPAPVVHPNTPIGYEQNKRNIVVGSVSEKNLLLAPAERADVIIDFSQYAGQTIILYNDSPAPVPAGDPRNDFYTGNPDQTANGGAPSTLAGFGPNTRTVMQFRVAPASQATPAPQFAPATPPPAGPLADPPAALTTALAAAFAATLDPPIVNGVTSRIQDTSIPFTPQPLAAVVVDTPGSGYTTAPTVKFLGGLPGTGAAATATVAGGKVTAITLTNPGSGYSYAPTIQLIGGGGFGATASAVVANSKPMLPKTIQELFDPLGRMNATLGVELPFTKSTIQTTVPLGFVDPVTETLAPGEVQLWKITHNGVDTHGVHFHLVNVQVINRVGWDGAIRATDPNEMGWKDTVRMNPLEDIIVAAKAKPPVLPFGQPDSIRPLDVTQPLGSTANFANIDPLTGNPPATPVSNVLFNFNAEYTWHCHLLGHEENDMMRPMVLLTNNALPPAFVQNPTTIGAGNLLSWVDPTPFDYVTGLPLSTLNNPANEIGFKILRADGPSGGSFAEIAAVPANATSYTDAAAPTSTSRYQIVAYNAAGSTTSNTVLATTVPPPAITTTALPGGIVGTPYSQTLAATGGIAPLSWALSAGALPAGLTLNPATGVIAGTPTAAGSFSFTVQLSDAAGRSATQPLGIVVTTPVAVSTASLPGALVGIAYSQTLAATGGTQPYVWSLSAGALPTSLTLDPASGLISGTPSAAGTFNFTVSVSAANGTSATRALSIVVTTPFVITTTSPLPGAVIGLAYSQTLAATGAPTPFTWSISTPSLPTGLTLSAAGVISGTPSVSGTSNFAVRVRSSNGSSITKNFSITVTTPVRITTTTLAGGFTGSAYNQTLAAAGGTTPYLWNISLGALPTGLTLSTAGAITGTPTAAGSFGFTARVTSANGSVATQAFTITIQTPASITTASLPGATTGVPYSQTLAATGATTPYTWSIAVPSLPTGLTLSAAGVISGTPTITGTSNFSVRVTAANGSTATKAFSITVTAPVRVTTTTLASGTVGTAYNRSVAATGATTPYTWTLDSGALPSGLSLSTAGAITGIPGAAGTSSFTVRVTAANGSTATQALSIIIR